MWCKVGHVTPQNPAPTKPSDSTVWPVSSTPRCKPHRLSQLKQLVHKCAFRFWGRPSEQAETKLGSLESGPQKKKSKVLHVARGVPKLNPICKPTFHSVSQMWSQIFERPRATGWILLKHLLIHPRARTLFRGKVDGCVAQIQHVNLNMVGQPGCVRYTSVYASAPKHPCSPNSVAEQTEKELQGYLAHKQQRPPRTLQ